MERRTSLPHRVREPVIEPAADLELCPLCRELFDRGSLAEVQFHADPDHAPPPVRPLN
jgi:hypothetical protein